MKTESRLFEVYKLGFQHTEAEVGALWQRNQSYLLANSLLGILVAEVADRDLFAAGLTIFCLLLSLLWVRASWFSTKWERYWIREMQRLEETLDHCELWTRAGSKKAIKQGRPPIKWDAHEVFLASLFAMGWSVASIYFLCRAFT